jgi:RND family efflux transporter, MFP subunit
MTFTTRIPAAGVLMLAIALGGCRHAEPAAEASEVVWTSGTLKVPTDSPMLKQIRREKVADAELATDEVVAPGKIEANPNRVSKVVVPVAGRVARVLVAVGDAVRQGQPLFTIDSPDADAATSTHLQADAAVSQARATLIKSQADAERSKDLFEHNAIAKKDVLTADSALAQSQAALDQALAAREQAERRLSVLGLSPRDFKQQVTVRAPLSGKVLDLSVVPGEYRNDTSAPVMTIADLSTVWVSSQVPETYIRFIQPHEKVEISLVAYPDETFEGRVLRSPTPSIRRHGRSRSMPSSTTERPLPPRNVRQHPSHRVDDEDAAGTGGCGDRGRRARNRLRRAVARHVRGAHGRRSARKPAIGCAWSAV